MTNTKKNKIEITSTMILDTNSLSEELRKENPQNHADLNDQDLFLLKKYQLSIISKKNPSKSLKHFIEFLDRHQIDYSQHLPLKPMSDQAIIIQIEDFAENEIEKIANFPHALKIAHLPKVHLNEKMYLNLKKFKILIHDFELVDLLEIISSANQH